MKFKEIAKKNYACVYCITFKDGKQYVGQTKCMAKRAGLYLRNLEEGKYNSFCLRAIKECGIDNTDWAVLCKVSDMHEEDKILCLNILEMKYIKEKNTLYPNGYNRTKGGESLRISSDYLDLLSCRGFYNGKKRLSLYDLNGIFIREFNSISECAYELGISNKCVSKSVNHRCSTFLGKYMIREIIGGDFPKKIEPYKVKHVTKTVTDVVHKERVVYKDKVVYVDKLVDREVRVNGKHVLKYDLNGSFVCEYVSITKASESVGRSKVSIGKVTNGFYFILKDGNDIKTEIGKIDIDEVNREPVNRKLRNDFCVEQYDNNGNLINTYSGLRDASKKTGIPYPRIWACIFGNSKHAGGFTWKKK